jgi:hypothetical protein
MVVRDTDQTAVEHPMRSPGKGKSIVYNIRPIGFNGPYVRGFDLGPSVSVD